KEYHLDRDSKIATCTFADHAVPGGTFRRRHSGPVSEECSLPRSRQKLAQLEEAKQASIQQIQNAIDMEKSQQALTQKRHYLFDVQREKETVAKCIADLKLLAKKAQAPPVM
uniref:ATP synthase subunit b n=1 Tax=Papio anubis TaxID=9555 RepID=A0A8I5R5U7_PAPAN